MFRLDQLLVISRQLLYVQHTVFSMLKILKLCKIACIYIVTKSIKYGFVCNTTPKTSSTA
jgi:hypothetical protein